MDNRKLNLVKNKLLEFPDSNVFNETDHSLEFKMGKWISKSFNIYLYKGSAVKDTENLRLKFINNVKKPMVFFIYIAMVLIGLIATPFFTKFDDTKLIVILWGIIISYALFCHLMILFLTRSTDSNFRRTIESKNSNLNFSPKVHSLKLILIFLLSLVLFIIAAFSVISLII